MARRLPPLNALRAFEAAARLLSFKRAAAELNVTPAAVSQQIKALEAAAGVRLFRRLPRALLLTDAGQRALPHLTAGLDRLARGVAEMTASGAGAITVSVAPSFGGRWLVPRLGRTREAHPALDLRIDANDRLVDFDREDVDLAIRFGRGDYPGLGSVCLFCETAVPVCAPALLAGAHPIRTPADLRHHTLLHLGRETLSDTLPNWRMWLKAAGAAGIDAGAGPRFSDFTMVLMAAVAGQGVALSPRALAADELRAGRLVLAFDHSVGAAAGGEFAYHLVWPEGRDGTAGIRAFRNWLLAEVAAYCAEQMAAGAPSPECRPAG